MSIIRYSSGKALSVPERIRRHRARHIAMSRRRFIQAATGATALGVALGADLLRPRVALAEPGLGNVLPIPTTLNLFGVDAHVQAPPVTGADTDVSTVWNFQGASAIGLINTTATQTNRRTGEVQEDLDSSFNHMTFLKGVYEGRDGHVREGTFSLV